MQDFLSVQSNEWNLDSLLVGAVLLIAPALGAKISQLTRAFFGAVMSMISEGYDFVGIVTDALHGNTQGAIDGLFKAGFEAFNLFWQGLNWIDQAELADLRMPRVLRISSPQVQFKKLPIQLEVSRSGLVLACSLQISFPDTQNIVLRTRLFSILWFLTSARIERGSSD